MPWAGDHSRSGLTPLGRGSCTKSFSPHHSLLGLRRRARSTRKPPRRCRTPHAFSPAHADLARSVGVPARLANEAYVEALARVVYYWAYPAVDIFGRTSMWETMKEGPGMLLGTAPGGP